MSLMIIIAAERKCSHRKITVCQVFFQFVKKRAFKNCRHMLVLHTGYILSVE